MRYTAAVRRDRALLSDEARGLYRGLIERRVPQGVDEWSGAAREELLDLGLAQVEDDSVIAVSPPQGQSNLAVVLHKRTREMLEQLTEVSDFLGVCAHSHAAAYARSAATEAESVRVVTDADEMTQLSSEIPAIAQCSYCSVQTGNKLRETLPYQMTGPVAKPASDDDARSRVIVDRRMARDPQASTRCTNPLTHGLRVTACQRSANTQTPGGCAAPQAGPGPPVAVHDGSPQPEICLFSPYLPELTAVRY